MTCIYMYPRHYMLYRIPEVYVLSQLRTLLAEPTDNTQSWYRSSELELYGLIANVAVAINDVIKVPCTMLL